MTKFNWIETREGPELLPDDHEERAQALAAQLFAHMVEERAFHDALLDHSADSTLTKAYAVVLLHDAAMMLLEHALGQDAGIHMALLSRRLTTLHTVLVRMRSTL